MSRPVALLAAAALALAACAGSERTDVTNVMVSAEKQRADLTRARDLGIISEEEYQQELREIGAP